MQTSLLATALLMGLAGSAHCAVMCGATSSGVVHLVRGAAVSANYPGELVREAGTNAPASAPSIAAVITFHAARLAGYGAAGALAAAAFGHLGALSAQMAALRPFWMLLHVGICVWGLCLLLLARQPLWAHRIGADWSARLRRKSGVGSLGTVAAAGALWVLLPCGLLYSALMVAGLSNDPLQGAIAMGLFALASAPPLVLAPFAWRWMQRWGGSSTGQKKARQTWVARVSGAVLVAVSGHAIWMQAGPQFLAWCA